MQKWFNALTKGQKYTVWVGIPTISLVIDMGIKAQGAIFVPITVLTFVVIIFLELGKRK